MTLTATQSGNVPLAEHDPELFDIIEKEKNRQWSSLELIASEVCFRLLRCDETVTGANNAEFYFQSSHGLSWECTDKQVQ